MDRGIKTLLIASGLYFNECEEVIRIMNCNGQSILFNTDSWEVKLENFTNDDINGLAIAIIKLKEMER